MRAFKIEVGEVRYWGSWLQQGDMVKVRSDYGSTSYPLEGRDPAVVAREALMHLLPPHSWRTVM